ncbi:acyl carrier protein [Novosphingobium mangrovi (ex Huang et al. 2023)]|uniref:Acyl carrier protein n=1 Tax=Novosphingobium mangrovi (ex Huang et al. 2023) TaxID=2976432 RepID=A0ABT2I0J8_9SPHN|nr:acyl carrier protein [Novosphingobium mangrovi (ex Huang et al. 2023)]MCT2398330.1 acyl carrier protein [Novosphingobium mangrovi (ex Huang et al. 2023)]
MTKDEIRKLAIDILGGIAPEADFDMLEDDEELREALDLDSMDFLNFITGLHKATGADIPEADYAQLSSLQDVVAYLTAKTA